MTEKHRQSAGHHTSNSDDRVTSTEHQQHELNLDDLGLPDFDSLIDDNTWPLYTDEAFSELRDKLKTSKGSERKRYDERTRHLMELLETESNQRRYRFSESAVDDLESLSKEMPNFSPVIDSIAGAVSLARKRNRPIELTPILIEGGAGIGKSHFANRLSEILSVPFTSHDMASTQNVASLAGLDRHWGNTEIGDVLNTLLTGDHMSPVFMLDEIDKASYGNNLGDPLSSLYGLLEPENSRAFRDRSMPLPVNARHIIWIATANDASGRLPRPLLSRFHYIRVEEPTPDQRRHLSESFINERINQHEQETREKISFDEEVVETLSNLPPRKQKQCIEHIMNQLARKNAKRISMTHFPHTLCDYEDASIISSDGVGFLANII